MLALRFPSTLSSSPLICPRILDFPPSLLANSHSSEECVGSSEDCRSRCRLLASVTPPRSGPSLWYRSRSESSCLPSKGSLLARPRDRGERGRAQASDLRRTRDTCPDARRPGLHHPPAALLPALMSRTLCRSVRHLLLRLRGSAHLPWRRHFSFWRLLRRRRRGGGGGGSESGREGGRGAERSALARRPRVRPQFTERHHDCSKVGNDDTGKRSAPTTHIADLSFSTSIVRAVRTPDAGLALECIECRHEIIRLVLFHRFRNRVPKSSVQRRIFRPPRRRPVCVAGIQDVECAGIDLVQAETTIDGCSDLRSALES
ncbi:hypothetical protein KC367_g39 [Hortaea werneckii]|nr:hypothetical protein KC367_g39 [Hortaea werneckii]